MSTGVWKILFGLFVATTISIFAVLSAELIATVAGLALTGVLVASISGAMAELQGREAGLVAMLCTAANFTLFGIGAPFWGLVFGILIHFILTGSRAVALPTGLRPASLVKSDLREQPEEQGSGE